MVPLSPAFYPTDDPYRLAPLAARLREAYTWDGRDGLAWELRDAVYEVAHRRARTPEERRALVAWMRYTLADAEPAWLAYAAAHGWRCPQRLPRLVARPA
ncbi:hypothetical protein Q2K19_10600 [Micromonospora soli]|uniref:hypothetical protein n=1 Tax=Micromonospora sp. NBRC 110009 TaxID=3061627 RepID=UPI0026735118|nr:hypothetical protein [Micromonospora sp. NBRC 110009]WKU00887.1 hypothetical protein Q2K19_10600 [Micromonospora sp. NBRC 110009]